MYTHLVLIYKSRFLNLLIPIFSRNTNFMKLSLTKRQREIVHYIRDEHLPSLIVNEEKATVFINEDDLASFKERLAKMQVLSSICGRILEKVPEKKSTPVTACLRSPPPEIRPPVANTHEAPLPISAGGYTIFKFSIEKYKDPDAIRKILMDLNLEVEEGWITCPDSLLETVTITLEKLLINIGEEFFSELDSVVHQSVNHKLKN